MSVCVCMDASLFKVRALRKKFRTAVNESTRSGSGRLIIDNWEKLSLVWGGCPAVTSVAGAISSAASGSLLPAASGDVGECEDISDDDLEDLTLETPQQLPAPSKAPSAAGSRKTATDFAPSAKRRKLSKNLPEEGLRPCVKI